MSPGRSPCTTGAGIGISGGAKQNTVGGSTIAARNLISGNTVYGLGIFDRFTSNNVVAGNYIGTDITGKLAVPNGEGVRIFSAASKNVIGGTSPGARNLISGNIHRGVYLLDSDTAENALYGNYIGTDVTGTLAVPNGSGVELAGGANQNHIGGFDKTSVVRRIKGTSFQGI